MLDVSVGAAFFAFCYTFLSDVLSIREAVIYASTGFVMDTVLYFSPIAAGMCGK